MAAFQRIAGNITIASSSFVLPSALFICSRGIASKLFVGGLPFYMSESGLTEAFSPYGQVVEAKIVADRVTNKPGLLGVHLARTPFFMGPNFFIGTGTNKPKGFGFVTFASEDEAYTALTEMDGKTLSGRVIFVDYAKPKLSTAGEIPIARGPPKPSEICTSHVRTQSHLIKLCIIQF